MEGDGEQKGEHAGLDIVVSHQSGNAQQKVKDPEMQLWGMVRAEDMTVGSEHHTCDA